MQCLISHDVELQLPAEGIVGYVVVSNMYSDALLFESSVLQQQTVLYIFSWY